MTPPLDQGIILPGVTRTSLMELARGWVSQALLIPPPIPHILLTPVNTLAGQLCVNYHVIAHSLSIVALPKINIPIVDRRCRIVLVLVLIIRGILSVGQ